MTRGADWPDSEPNAGDAGTNRGSWLNADYDRLQSAFRVTLDRSQRQSQLIQMAKVVSEELPSIPLYYRAKVVASVPIGAGG